MTDRNSWGGQPRNDSWGAAPGTAGHAGSGLAPRKETSAGKRAGVIAVAIASVVALAGGLAWAAVAVSGGETESPDAVAVSSLSSTSSMPTTSSPITSIPTIQSQPVESTAAASETLPTKSYDSLGLGRMNAVSVDEKCDRYAAVATEYADQMLQKYCDSSWLFVAKEQSAVYDLFYWVSDGWKLYDPDGTMQQTNFGCYDIPSLKYAGAPQGLIEQLPACDTTEYSGEIYEADGGNTLDGGWGVRCDGRYILIVESVIVPLGGNPDLKTRPVQQEYPGSKVVNGSACSSIQGNVDGGYTYAVYFDAGHDRKEVCRLKAKYGGDARSLNNDSDSSDPC
ncbi:hypothetical protein QP888_07115 [Corynebacterium sp. MSK297]|uniref:hypothetical protein n=1 Tax=Corynebacterium sp. MSK297 TaxID=3050221 RepID=UPI00254AB7C8|nr:hypothetical protein [Corynebacterium sp. MSK297]MDK8846272.1 hypothetical protein [Corynebacterium sp. MSK297]